MQDAIDAANQGIRKTMRTFFSRCRTNVLVVATVALLAVNAGQDARAQEQQGVPVTIQAVEPESVPVLTDYPGRAHGARSVEVRARVGGVLEQRLYVEGQAVEAGTALFLIDPQPLEVALRRAVAERERAQAELAQARREWQRVSELFQNKTVSARERDRARSAVELAEAAVALAEAGVAQAQLELDYSRVQAPIGGVTGLETLPEGSLVERGTLLTTITQLDVIHVRFALPGRAPVTGGEQRSARLVLPDGTLHEHVGEVDFTNSTVDPATGTIQARAVFPNPERTVMPGQFVRVRIETDQLNDVFLVPPPAIVQGPEGPMVYVVGEDDMAHARPVVLGPVVDGRQVVTQGLETEDRLVVNGQVALRDGAPVTVSQAAGGEQ